MDGDYIPSFDDFALAKDEKTVRLSLTRSTSSWVFLYSCVSSNCKHTGRWQRTARAQCGDTNFSSRYSCPKLIRADSYSLVAASEVAAGALDVISL